MLILHESYGRGPSAHERRCEDRPEATLVAGGETATEQYADGQPEWEGDPKKRAAEYQQFDKLLAASVPSFPLFSRPNVLIHKSSLLSLEPGPALFYAMQNWHWKR